MRRVLVVEDDVTYREALVRALARQGYDAVGVSTVVDAERHAAETPPDFAIVDLRLSDGSGIDVVRAFTADAPSCRVVVLSGHATVRLAVEAMRAGAVDVLTKPVSSAEVARALEDAAAVTVPAAADGTMDAVEREHILRTLDAAAGNVSEASRRLGMHRRTLQRKLQRLP